MMIELKNIYKAYKSKKGNNTVALKDVSLKFEETGMTFILGKSGSGKSTLLNIIGGLDKYDSGDMIILGKSSKDFRQADFDSYRNTYIGFIFQEFNILEDYDVYQNIVLALQLQQKSTNNKIDELLNKLELNSLKHRKVNELSGGQKQRVAIARALIKNPKIILADEPTGNLDSSTSKQVMDLLKEISKEKLVIIVSHDKESASIYGDRVIEIVDGKVESDIVKRSKQKETTDSYKIIKSKLPWKESFKLGLGSLKTKKIKLFFTIFLTIFTLLFLSLSDTLAGFDNETSHAKLLTSRQEQFVQIEKYKLYNNAEYVDKDKLALKEIDSKNILSKLNRDTYPIYQIQEDYNHMMVVNLFNISTDKDNTLYTPLSGSATADIVVTDDINKIIKEPVIGKKPTANNEIVISNYIADLIIDKGITVYENIVNNEFGVSNLFKPKNYEELINSNHTFYFGSVGKAKIVGLVNYDLSKYQCLKGKKYDADNISEEEVKLSRELTREIQNIYNKIYVNNDFISNLKVKDISFLYPNNTYNLISDEINLQQNGYHISPTILSKEIEYYNGTNWVKTNHLAKNEAILDVSQLVDFDSRNYIEELEKYLNKHEGENRELLEKKFFTNYVKDYKVFSKNIALKIYEGRSYNQKNPDRVFDNIKIIGLVDSNSNDKGNKSNYFSTELVNDYKINALQKTGVLVPVVKEKDFKNILRDFPCNNEISAKTTYSDEVELLIKIIDIFKNIAFYVSLVFLVFTIFLISNFIFTSIHYRKKEIGVLRALGARSLDIIKIFLWEGFIIALISGIISSIVLVICSNNLNYVLMKEIGLLLTPLIVSIRQFGLIFLVVILVVLISSVIPLLKISKMKPIDAILNK